MTTVAELRDRTRANQIYLVEIALRGVGAPTLYLAMLEITVGAQDYQRYIDSITGLDDSYGVLTGSQVNVSINIVFLNDEYGGNDFLIEIGDTYPFEGADCTIKEVYLDDDGVPSTAKTVYKGVLDEPANINKLTFNTAVSDKAVRASQAG